MKLGTLLSYFQTRPDADAALQDADLRVPKGLKLSRAAAPARPAASGKTESQPVDRVVISTQAAYVLAASQFDPREISEADTRRMADQLLQGNAISERDARILVTGAAQERAAQSGLADPPRDLLAAFQTRLSGTVGRTDFLGVNAATRAVSILGRIAAIRDVID